MANNKNQLEEALAQRQPVPPLQRGKGLQLSIDAEQERKPAPVQPPKPAVEEKSNDKISQNRKNAKVEERKEEATLSSGIAEMQDSEITDDELRSVAKLLRRINAMPPDTGKAKRQKEDLAETLVKALANAGHEDFRNLADKQRSKVNQGVTLPEGLFTIYKSCANSLTIKGERTTMGDLMTKALTKYLVEDILPKL